jgi:O-methyltransferase involved in polyketide biosynthesis
MLRDRPSLSALLIATMVSGFNYDLCHECGMRFETVDMTRLLLKAYGGFWFRLWLFYLRFLGQLLTMTSNGAKLEELLARRKVYHEKHVRNAISGKIMGKAKVDPCQQVLVVAGGYDTLALRLAWEFPNVQFFEFDHPATGRAKDNAVQKLLRTWSGPHSLPKNYHTIRIELTTTDAAVHLDDVLNSESVREAMGYDSTKRTAVVAEGLFTYLKEAMVRRLLQDVSKSVGLGSSTPFCFTGWHEKENLIDMGFSVRQLEFIAAIFGYFGEHFLWGIDPRKLESFVGETAEEWRLCTFPMALGAMSLATLDLVSLQPTK